MPSRSSGVRTGIQLLLVLAIAVLSYWLYHSLTAPYEAVERERAATERTRRRMAFIRTEMVRYEAAHGRYPSSLDTLVLFVKQDSLAHTDYDSVPEGDFVPDSLPFSPRTGKPFILIVRDTEGVATYLLKDPDSNDRIGTLTPDAMRINTASWE